eukprot:scaffold179_cov368-Prasinococcus_capsulatus_cf.AAC.7
MQRSIGQQSQCGQKGLGREDLQAHFRWVPTCAPRPVHVGMPGPAARRGASSLRASQVGADRAEWSGP